MQIVKVQPFNPVFRGTVEEIVSVYQDAFSGPPWGQTWSKEQVLKDFFAEMLKSRPLCLVARAERQVLGFAWGYDIRISKEVEEKLEAPGLCQHVEGNLHYLDELAVMQENQGKGIGKTLLQEYLKQRPGRVLLRTKQNSVMHALTKKAGGLDLQCITEDRVIVLIP